MAVSAKVYGLGMKSLASKLANLSSDTLKVSLHTSTYAPNQDTHQFQSDLTNEVTGTGYTAGGQALTSVTLTYTAATNVLMLDAADVSWASSTITARYAVVYDATPGTAATNPLICYVDFGADVSSTAATFQIVWDAAGIVTFTAA
jgi:hypothetical protein